MVRVTFVRRRAWAVLWIALPAALSAAAEPPAPGIAERTPWTRSRIQGTPTPPPPYRTERVFPNLQFDRPVALTHAPGSGRLFVAQLDGRVFTFENRQSVERAPVAIHIPRLLDRKTDATARFGRLYGLAFHPDFQSNRYVYVCYTLQPIRGGFRKDGTIVSRLRLTESSPPTVVPGSETVLLRWLAGGHNGGCLKFGPSGDLYISTGDGSGPNPPDKRRAAQDLGNLLGSVLRIDVDDPEGGRAYSIPEENPFRDREGARPEIWAYGFRNPWRMSFDRKTGELWVGDVGWQLWEMAHRVERGGNYGWSIREGPQPVHPDGDRGPTPIEPPAIRIRHPRAASITGGYVYRGDRLPKLRGAYIFGDWRTRRIWAADVTSGTGEPRELVDPTLQVIAFGEDEAGELYVLDYDGGTVHQLVRNKGRRQKKPFPKKLSETGLFASVEDLEPAPGVVPFSINAPKWEDGAVADRWIALPGRSSVVVYEKPVSQPGTTRPQRRTFPDGAVLVKTLFLSTPSGRRRVETQLLHREGARWHGYTYRWNASQTDATLVKADGADRVLTVETPSGETKKRAWHFPARAECARCHNPWAGRALGFRLPQLDKTHRYGEKPADQIRTLGHIGILETPEEKTVSLPALAEPRLVDPYDRSKPLRQRARSYLQVNCAHCHQRGAGGTARIDLRHRRPLEKTRTVGRKPMQGRFGIDNARILAAGDPYRSVLFYRLSTLGRAAMPRLGARRVDDRGVRLIHRWIESLGDDGAASEGPKPSLFRRLTTDGERDEGALSDAVDTVLDRTSTALRLAHAIRMDRVPDAVREVAVEKGTSRTPPIRGLFRPFLPRDRRISKGIDPEEVLRLRGDPDAGRRLFMTSPKLQCRTCHELQGTGQNFGPDLSRVGAKRNRRALLESIRQPSKTIADGYRATLVRTTDGGARLGFIVKTTDEMLTIKTAQGRVSIPREKVKERVPQKRSLMPKGLLRGLTAQEVADLLAFLTSLK